jgi:hypothetical protein
MKFEKAYAINPQWWPVKVLSEDVIELEQLGTDREVASQKANLKSVAKNQSAKLHQIGVQGEWAASLVYQLPFRTTPIAPIEELHSGDLGTNLEVKASQGAEPWQWDLIENEYRLTKPEFKNRIYIHTITAWWPDWVVVTGWAYGSEFLERGEKKKGATGLPIYVLPQKSFRNPKTLFDVLRKKNDSRKSNKKANLYLVAN